MAKRFKVGDTIYKVPTLHAAGFFSVPVSKPLIQIGKVVGALVGRDREGVRYYSYSVSLPNGKKEGEENGRPWLTGMEYYQLFDSLAEAEGYWKQRLTEVVAAAEKALAEYREILSNGPQIKKEV